MIDYNLYKSYLFADGKIILSYKEFRRNRTGILEMITFPRNLDFGRVVRWKGLQGKVGWSKICIFTIEGGKLINPSLYSEDLFSSTREIIDQIMAAEVIEQ